MEGLVYNLEGEVLKKVQEKMKMKMKMSDNLQNECF